MTNSSGGVAAATGFSYQCRVAAWIATHILAESGASTLWSLSSNSHLEWMQCESNQLVDDIVVKTSEQGMIFIQVKHRVNLSSSGNSDFASSIKQFVKQFIECKFKSESFVNRFLEKDRDRLVLVTSSKSSNKITKSLPKLLNKIRLLGVNNKLDSIIKTEEETEILNVLLGHINQIWSELLSKDPSNEELLGLLSLIYIQVLDLDTDESDNRETRNILRNIVLKEPSKDLQALDCLISFSGYLSTSRSGADRKAIQSYLSKAGLKLRETKSYEEDTKRLREYSSSSANLLKQHAETDVGNYKIKVTRESSQSLKKAIEDGSILITGEPGAGKSGTIYDLISELHKENKDYVFIAVDQIESESLSALEKEISLEHPLKTILNNWPGTERAYFIIDALDAARGEKSAKLIRDLITQINDENERWTIVASIRKFDLRYSEPIREMFKGNCNDAYFDPEFKNVRHFNIPIFSIGEIEQIVKESPKLKQLRNNATHELNELMRSPFNMSILIGLLYEEGITNDDLVPIKTQLELLEKYWACRIIDPSSRGESKEYFLKNVCDEMISTRSMRVNKFTVVKANTSAVVSKLLSDQVLVEWQNSNSQELDRYTLAFSHNLLFDYAISRLIFRGDNSRLITILTQSPDLSIFGRASLYYHYMHLWNLSTKHESFWNLVFLVLESNELLAVTNTTWPRVSVELCSKVSDFEQIYNSLVQGDYSGTAGKAFKHIAGAILTEYELQSSTIEHKNTLWSNLIEMFSRYLNTSIVFNFTQLLQLQSRQYEDLSEQSQKCIGNASRNLFNFSFCLQPRNSFLMQQACNLVARSFNTNVEESKHLIRKTLEEKHRLSFAYEEMWWIAKELNTIIDSDPAFAAEFYKVAFEHEEPSDEQTSIGYSRILPLLSNRKQDFEMTWYQLADNYSYFLSKEPKSAVEAALHTINAYVRMKHKIGSELFVFKFEDTETGIQSDGSFIWNEGDLYDNDSPVKILNLFREYLESISDEENKSTEVDEIIDLILQESRLAVVWRQLIKAAIKKPKSLGMKLAPILWSHPILICRDTTIIVGDFLHSQFGLLSEDQKRKVENVLLAIPKNKSIDSKNQYEALRNRLLGCLPEKLIVSNSIIHLLDELKKSDAVPKNEPFFKFTQWSEPYTYEDKLRESGVSLDNERYQEITKIRSEVDDFIRKNRNITPTLEASKEIFPSLEKLIGEITSLEDLPEIITTNAWDSVAEACRFIASHKSIESEKKLFEFISNALVKASRHTKPIYDEKFDSQFDESPSWSTPAPRIEAALGLIQLASNSKKLTLELENCIFNLSRDPVPSVRFQIARHLNALFNSAPELMWNTIEQLSNGEKSNAVLLALLSGPLSIFASYDPNRILTLVQTIFKRVNEGPGYEKVRSMSVRIFTNLYIWRNHQPAYDLTIELITSGHASAKELSYVVACFREALSYTFDDSEEGKKYEIAGRAWDILIISLSNLQTLLESYNAEAEHFSEEKQKELKSILHNIDTIGSAIYFSSGAYEKKGSNSIYRRKDRKEYFMKAEEPLMSLADLGIASVTHHVLQTLEYFIDLEPKKVFLLIERVLRGSIISGYQYESLASDLVVKLVKTYLADHLTLLRNDDDCRKSLIEILSIFVDAGWSQARMLTYRLEEIYR